MKRIDEVLDAWIEIGRQAADRWKEREDQRNEIKHKLDTSGAAAVESPELVERFGRRAQGRRLEKALHPRPLPDAIRAERIIGLDDRRKLPETVEQLEAGQPVARVVALSGPLGQVRGFGTGFMISPRLMMTNHHVLRNTGDARESGANFGHNFVSGGDVEDGQVFEFDPDMFFTADEALDYAVVAVKTSSLKGTPLNQSRFHVLDPEPGKTLLGSAINIIQHPDGGGKMYATSGNKLVDRLDNFLHYKTDTRPGSSGSPCFNEFWDVVALHHSGVPKTQDGQILNKDDRPWDRSQGVQAIQWIANEGVRISKIAAHLKSQNLASSSQDQLRDEIFSIEQPIEGASAIPDVFTPKRTGANASEIARTDAAGSLSARTIVQIYGTAKVYTGTVNQPASSAVSASTQSERAERRLFLEKKLEFDPHYGRRQGYDPRFLVDHEVGLPSVDPSRSRELVTDRRGNLQVLDYHHFSLAMNKKWLMQMWSAVNVDYSPEVRWDIARKEFGSDTWIHDPRISEALQIDNEELYKPAKKFDRGHVVRRDDNAWGATREEVVFANSDTFHWTNCTPQHENFNRSSRKGVWGRLENHIADQANAVSNRLLLFSGPVLDKKRAIPHDFGGGIFRVPLDFWKVVVVAEDQDGSAKPVLRAYGFVLEQKKAIDLKGLEKLSTEERFDVGEFEEQQRSLAAISKMSGIIFPNNVAKADVMSKAAISSVVALDRLEAIKH